MTKQNYLSAFDRSLANNNQLVHRRVEPANNFERFPMEETEHSVARRFEKLIVRYPNYLAIKDKEFSLTYSEFNGFANRIARAILSKKYLHEEPIVLLFEQGANFIVSIFGILKTGNFYVPIDPSFPESRNSYIVEDSQAILIVTNSKNLATAKSLTSKNCDILNIDSIAEDVSSENLNLVISPDALAYLIYTSGSTGKPKGVFQNQRNLLHNAMNQINAFHLGVGDRMPLVHSCSVMGAVRVIYNALLSGTSLYPLDVKAEGLTALRTLLTEERITVFHSVATLFRHFADIFTDTNLFSNLRLVILGGEAMNRKDVELYKRHFPDNCLLCTGLGSTEAGTIRVFMLDKQTEITTSLVPPGYGVEGVEVLLLDENENEVEVGEVGEIVVKSQYLALGYWRQPELTQKQFSHVSENSSERLLRTGDMGTFLADGCLVHVGRKDFQVKIRGYRVNISEIEMALMDYGFLKEAVVKGHEDSRGEMFLAAYAVPRQESRLTVSELRHFIAQKLPDYMIPSRFIFLDSLPLTANGKVNRLALSLPKQVEENLAERYMPPTNAIEAKIVKVWENLLQLESVGINHSLLNLGGNSLIGMQIVSHLRDLFQVELAPQDLFANPTVASIADVIQKRIDCQHDSSISKMSQKAAKIPAIVRRTGNSPAPLSRSQQRIWVFEQLGLNDSTYVVSKALHLQGFLNLEALQRTIDEIVKRHEVLRTVFISVDGEPKQVVNPPRPVEMPLVDLSAYSSAEQRTSIQKIIEAEDRHSFNLETDLLLRCRLIRLNETEHIFVLVRHHLASDGWSLGIIWQEMSQIYAAFTINKPSPLPELEIQFADFAVWESQWLSGNVLESQLAYWKRQLADAPTLLQLPTDRPRPPVQTFKGQTKSFSVNAELTERLQLLNRRVGVTLFMTLLTTLYVLLARYTGEEDILVGSMIANRNHREIEPLIGFFSSILVLRNKIEKGISFGDLLMQVRETALEAFTHKDVPLEELTSTLKPQRSPSHTPWFQVLFLMQNFPMEVPNLTGLNITSMAIDESAKYDLTLSVTETTSGLMGSFTYNTDLFDADTIDRMVGHFQILLEGFAEDPELPVFGAPLMPIAEQHQILQELNQTQCEFPKDCCIHQLFEERVELSPTVTAIVYENQTLSYRELNNRANQLARHLKSLGVGSETLVGICVERSLEMVVGLLSILKAGGAYVPLDPSYPQERLALMLEDSQLSVIVTQSYLQTKLPQHPAQIVCLDTDWEIIARECADNLNIEVTSNNLAYVIYTSGSTGKPKGVQIEHRGVVNFLCSMEREPGITSEDVLLAVTTISFDIAVLEIFLPLAVGAKVILASREIITNPTKTIEVLAESGVTIMQATPVTWRMMLAAGWQGKKNLKILCGGEAMPRSLANQLLSKSAEVWNMYGPTETTIWSTVERIEPVDSTVLVGRAIANTKTYIIDINSNLKNGEIELVPIGVPGELLIGGVGLSRGYLNRQELTDEKFIPDPFSDPEGYAERNRSDARLYRTGDLGRFLADGKIELIGRIDRQVKIRGFRIELGEVEAVLAQHQDLREIAVIIREDIPGDRRLVAYLVAKEQPSISDLRSFLQQRLPNYMIPSMFVFLDTIPLTPNGKINRRALPEPDTSNIQLENNFVPPSNSTEEMLVTIWTDILNVNKIGINDNFFDLGGHSLLATQVIFRCYQAFSVEISLRYLFENPTIAELSDRISTLLWLKESTEISVTSTANEREEFEI